MTTTSELPPEYYAVIFTSTRRVRAGDGYDDLANAMVRLAASQPGFLGVDSARGSDGAGITVSYWSSLDAIREWKNNVAHREAQRKGKDGLYESWNLRICKVERASRFRL